MRNHFKKSPSKNGTHGNPPNEQINLRYTADYQARMFRIHFIGKGMENVYTFPETTWDELINTLVAMRADYLTKRTDAATGAAPIPKLTR